MLKAICSFLLLLPSYACAETIHYTITQMGMKAGTATLAFKGNVDYQGQQLFLIEFKAKGFNFLDEEWIYVDLTHFRPRFVERNLNIFGNKERIREAYEQGQIVITKSANGTMTQQVLKNNQEVDNIYGFIHRFRQSGKIEIGESFDIHLPTKDVMMKVSKKWPLNIDGRMVDGVYIESKPAKYKIWFDTSQQRIPLRISGAMGIANTAMTYTKVTD